MYNNFAGVISAVAPVAESHCAVMTVSLVIYEEIPSQ
jgi:hypothetical protein